MTISLEFGDRINLLAAEEAVKALGVHEHVSESIRLDLSKCEYLDLGVGTRVGNALRRYGHPNRVTVIVPPVSGDKPFQGRTWFRVFTRSGLGLAISKYATEIISEERDISDLVCRYYATQIKPQWTNLVIAADLERGEINVERLERFSLNLNQWFPFVNVDAATFSARDLDSLAQILFESIQNVVDHAKGTPLQSDTKTSSYFSMRYYKSLSAAHAFPRYLAGYFSSLQAKLGTDSYHPGFVEIVVNDDGVGVAARQSQNPGIYWSTIEEETQALAEALRDSMSVKRRVKDAAIRGDPGFGLSTVKAGLHRIGACAILRTGRKAAVLSALDESGPEFILQPEEYGYMPGTTLQTIVPFPAVPVPPTQGRLF